MGKTVNSVITGPLPYCFYCEVHFLIRNSAMWNTMVVDRVCYKSWLVTFAQA